MGLYLNYSNDGSPQDKYRKLPFPYEKKIIIIIIFPISYLLLLLLYKLCMNVWFNINVHKMLIILTHFIRRIRQVLVDPNVLFKN